MIVLYVSIQGLRRGQAARTHVLEIARAMRRRGERVTVLALRDGSGNGAGIGGVLARLALILKAARLASRYNVVYARSHPLLWPLAVWCSWRRIPVVIEVNGPFHDTYLAYPWARPLRRPLDWTARDTLRRASGIVAVTAPLVKWVRGFVRHGTPVALITNGASPARATVMRPALVRPSAPYVVFFGALARWQGVAVMLEAATHPEWPDRVQFLVVGEGVCAGEITAAARMGERVQYCGALDPPALRWLVSGALATLSVQDDSGGRTAYGIAPLKVFESIALGVPVIVSAWPGQRDIVEEHDCGVVVAPGDAGELARAVRKLVAERAWRDRLAANATAAAAHHSWEARAVQTSQFLDDVITTSGRVS